MMSNLKWFNLALRIIMELGIVIAFGYWGYKTGKGIGMKTLLCIGAPMLGFGFWGLVDFRRAGKISEILRLIQELTISGVAVVSLYVVGAKGMGVTLGLISIFHHAGVYLAGETLLKGDSK